jgi:hypothetical protein
MKTGAINKKTEMMNFEAVFHNRRILIISFLSASVFWSSSFLPRFAPSFTSPEIKFFYFLSFPVVLLIITFFGFISLIRFVIEKRGDNPPSKVSAVGVSLLLSFIILSPLTFAAHRYIPRALPTGSDMKSFDPVIWKSESSTGWNEGISVREKMLKDVVDKVLQGKSKQEIVNALGASIETDYFSSLDKDLIYYLGPERDGLFTIDSEWLLIWIDEDGQFKRYVIAND